MPYINTFYFISGWYNRDEEAKKKFIKDLRARLL
jgi:hypothetical protein